MYRFGQFRKTQCSSYLTPLNYTLEDLEVSSVFSEDTKFLDKVLKPSVQIEAITTDGKQRSYYLRFRVTRPDSINIEDELSINIKLVNSNKQLDNERILKTILVENRLNQEDIYSYYEIIISPSDVHSYNQIIFEINRKPIDTKEEYFDSVTGTYGRKAEIQIEQFAEIKNIIDLLGISSSMLKQIGVQGKSGLLMSINGEEIRVGRSGLYEINNGINITFIGFISNSDDDNFLLDYQY